jgi:hypothetical protein
MKNDQINENRLDEWTLIPRMTLDVMDVKWQDGWKMSIWINFYFLNEFWIVLMKDDHMDEKWLSKWKMQMKTCLSEGDWD